jgi:hypothetical protein
VNLRFRAKENAELQNTDCTITAIADYVYKTSAGEKLAKQVTGSTNFTTSGLPGDTDGDGVITLIDISNIVDMFGVNSEDPLWAEARFFDFNNNNEIDIADIVVIAKQIH